MADTSMASPIFSEANETVVPRGDRSKEFAASRVTVRLTGDLGEAIEKLQEVTSASSPSDVVRRAIVIYHTLVQQKLKGNEPFIEVHEQDGTRKKIPVFL